MEWFFRRTSQLLEIYRAKLPGQKTTNIVNWLDRAQQEVPLPV